MQQRSLIFGCLKNPQEGRKMWATDREAKELGEYVSENNRGLLIVLGALILVILIAPTISGMLSPLGGGGTGALGTSPTQQGTTPAPGSAAPGVAGGLASGLSAGLSSLSMLALWGVLVVGVVLLVSRLGGTTSFMGSGRGAEDESLSTLRRRYAAGEISQEEYEQMRQVLER
jgi:putative membrane protein